MLLACGLWQSSHESVPPSPLNSSVALPPVAASPPGTTDVVGGMERCAPSTSPPVASMYP